MKEAGTYKEKSKYFTCNPVCMINNMKGLICSYSFKRMKTCSKGTSYFQNFLLMPGIPKYVIKCNKFVIRTCGRRRNADTV
jgi:hypothetical protein